jgi:hypothetical protein
MSLIRVICLSALLIGCGNSEHESNENYREKIIGDSKYIYQSYSDSELDSIWKFDMNGNLESVFTGDSTGKCLGTISGFYTTGELKFTGYCNHHDKIGQWYFFKNSGDLNFINYYTDNGELYQRWFIQEGDTSKKLFPIIDLEPRVAHVNEEIHLRVNYKFDGIDTTGWDYFFVHDFIEKEDYDPDQILPKERFRDPYNGEVLSIKLEFLAPDELAMFGYTLAVNRETGDSIFHLEIRDQFLTIVDTISQEL